MLGLFDLIGRCGLYNLRELLEVFLLADQDPFYRCAPHRKGDRQAQSPLGKLDNTLQEVIFRQHHCLPAYIAIREHPTLFT
jgi:hypothetical protein